jgi:hypothetical protein
MWLRNAAAFFHARRRTDRGRNRIESRRGPFRKRCKARNLIFVRTRALNSVLNCQGKCRTKSRDCLPNGGRRALDVLL